MHRSEFVGQPAARLADDLEQALGGTDS